MTRARRPEDWAHDLATARPVEEAVRERLQAHPEVKRLVDATREVEGLDFEFKLDGELVRVDVKEKLSPLTPDYLDLWPGVPGDELFVLDETSLRSLAWDEGLGYLLVHDRSGRRWLVFGPWELLLAPHPRFERLGDRGSGSFLKGKLLLDMRTAAAIERTIPVDALLQTVRRSRAARRSVAAVRIAGQAAPTLVPKPRGAAPSRPTEATQPGPEPLDAATGPWTGLHPALVAYVGERGWASPTAVQQLALAPVLEGENVLVNAPTAGGKTEAALLPALSAVASRGWPATSVVLLSPMRALLNDQLGRVRRLAAAVDRTCFAWHADVSLEERRTYLERPADILLTTPESLERILTRAPDGSDRMLRMVKVAIVDELHLLLGSPRGAQVAALMERMADRANADIQRIGLSATVGDPEAALGWLAGGSLRTPRIASVRSTSVGEELLLVAGAPSAAAALVTSCRAAGSSIIFAPSRRRAEQLASELGCVVHHSSLSADQRASAVASLAAPGGLIVATAGLEVGIDLPDVDLVVCVGAPPSPDAYLQRIGRSGRRSGNRRAAIVVTTAEELLLALAVVARARRVDLDAPPAARGARLVLGQQLLQLAFERIGLTREDAVDALRWSPVFRSIEVDVHETIDHLVGGAGWRASGRRSSWGGRHRQGSTAAAPAT